jgi:pimeloyl-ACP methyl ester carboxylesterase
MRTVDAFAKWVHDQRTCTSSATPVPVHESRRIVVLVSGLGTSSDSNTAWEVDTKSLGYADADVVRYSYQGGQAPRDGMNPPGAVQSVSRHPLDAITTRPFDSLDSQQSVGTSADHLSALLQSVAAAQPGTPIDVVAHSQGGVVARLAVERSGAASQLPSEVDTLVTLSSPQQGAPLATGVVALGDSPGGAAALSQIRASGAADELSNHLPAISDLAETSPIIDELHQRSMPEGVRFVAIGGSGDLVVPGSAAIDHAADASIILPTNIGKEAHGTLPSSPAATREIGLAVAGMGPTCQGLGPATKAFVTAETIRYGQTVAGASAAVAAGVLPIPPAD